MPVLVTTDMFSDTAHCNELFHTASGTAFADITIAGHRETWPIRSKRFHAFLKRSYYHATGKAASAAEIRSALDLLEARAHLMVRSAPSTSASPSRPGTSTSISPMSSGGSLRLALTDGE